MLLDQPRRNPAPIRTLDRSLPSCFYFSLYGSKTHIHAISSFKPHLGKGIMPDQALNVCGVAADMGLPQQSLLLIPTLLRHSHLCPFCSCVTALLTCQNRLMGKRNIEASGRVDRG